MDKRQDFKNFIKENIDSIKNFYNNDSEKSFRQLRTLMSKKFDSDEINMFKKDIILMVVKLLAKN